MDLVYLEYFKKAAEMQHITKAAQALNITQPTLSTAIRRLEEEFGMRLFEPDGRNVTLTQAGKILYQHFLAIDSELQKAYLEMAQLRELQNSQLDIICPYQIFERYVLGKVHQANPNITFNIRGRFDMQTQTLLEAGEIDLYISTPPFIHEKYDWEPLVPDPMMVIMSNDHPLAKKEVIDIHDLAAEKIISYPSSSLRDAVDQACRDAGFSPNVICEFANVREMIPLISLSNMVTIAPAGACLEAARCPDVLIRSILGIKQECYMGISWPKSPTLRPSAQLVLQAFREHYRDDPEKVVRRLAKEIATYHYDL